MVRRILSRISAPVRGLHQAAYVLAGLTLASQILALGRDRLFAHQFGASEILDVYYAAFKIPDLLFALIVSLVSAYVIIPRLGVYESEENKSGAKELISQASTFLLIAGGFASIIAAVCAPLIVRVLFPTLALGSHAGDLVFLTRLLLVQPIILGFSSILGSVTQLNRRFVLFALSPVLYNLGIILGTIFLYPSLGVVGIGIGVLVGALAHVAIHVRVVLSQGLFPRLVKPNFPLLWDIVLHSVPRSLALAMGSITTLLLIALASRTGEGGVSVYTLAGNLEAVPLSLIGAAYATAAFPVMADQIGKAKLAEYRQTITVACRHIIFWSSIITVLTIVLRAHIVRVILGSGAFNWDDTRLTAAVLAVLIVGLLAQGIILLAARAFYAANRSWNPLIVQLGDAGISVAIAYGLLRYARSHVEIQYFIEALFRVPDVPGSSILFIAVGATIGQLIMGVAALVTLRTVAPGVASGLMRPLFEGLGAAILGGAASYGVLTLLGQIAPLTHLGVVFAQGAIAGIVGLAIAGAVLAVLENQEFRDLIVALRKIRSFAALKPFARAGEIQ
jgi:putative peptidoglycan lipid II flippase